MKVKLLNNILSNLNNEEILKGLLEHHWFIARDNNTKNLLEKIQSNINSGFSVTTYHKDRPDWNSYLNKWGHLVFEKVIFKLKIKKYELIRFHWNMYFKGSRSENHIDSPDKNYFSIIYNLNNSDGGTKINKKFYKDKSGQAKIFKSNILHKGISSIKEHVRFNLNIVFKKIDD
jgi:hypothetical protein